MMYFCLASNTELQPHGIIPFHNTVYLLCITVQPNNILDRTVRQKINTYKHKLINKQKTQALCFKALMPECHQNKGLPCRQNKIHINKLAVFGTIWKSGSVWYQPASIWCLVF